MDLEPIEPEKPGVPTRVIADRNHVKPQTLIKAVCLDGHYFGIRPKGKLANGRWDWPDVPPIQRSADSKDR